MSFVWLGLGLGSEAWFGPKKNTKMGLHFQGTFEVQSQYIILFKNRKVFPCINLKNKQKKHVYFEQSMTLLNHISCGA